MSIRQSADLLSQAVCYKQLSKFSSRAALIHFVIDRLRNHTLPFVPDNIAPYRIFLDTGAFQAIHDCGGYVLAEDPFPEVEDFRPEAVPQVLRRSDGRAIVQSLAAIFAFNDRAQFDWIVSPASLAEIDAARDSHRSRYARDIMDHSDICLDESPPSENATVMAAILAGPTFGNLSVKDRTLLVEAAAADCDHFLTIEKRLPRQALVILKQIPFVICSPMELWKKLDPQMSGL